MRFQTRKSDDRFAEGNFVTRPGASRLCCATTVTAILASAFAAGADDLPQGFPVEWGLYNFNGSSYLGFVQVAAGQRYSLGLRADGSMAGWGRRGYEQGNRI